MYNTSNNDRLKYRKYLKENPDTFAKKESEQKPLSQAAIDKIVIGISNHVLNIGGRCEVVAEKQMERTRTGFKFTDKDERKAFADIAISVKNKKGAICIGRGAEDATRAKQLATNAGYSFINVAKLSEFKDWYKANF